MILEKQFFAEFVFIRVDSRLIFFGTYFCHFSDSGSGDHPKFGSK